MLLFDEPLSNLDANLRRSMREKIRELQKQFDITSLYVTHDQSEAFAVSRHRAGDEQGAYHADRLAAGSLSAAGVALYGELHGDANLFPAGFSADYVDISGYRLPRPAHFAAEGAGTVGVRPEAITLSEHGEESQRCVIQHVAYMGPQYEVTVAVAWAANFAAAG